MVQTRSPIKDFSLNCASHDNLWALAPHPTTYCLGFGHNTYGSKMLGTLNIFVCLASVSPSSSSKTDDAVAIQLLPWILTTHISSTQSILYRWPKASTLFLRVITDSNWGETCLLFSICCLNQKHCWIILKVLFWLQNWRLLIYNKLQVCYPL